MTDGTKHLPWLYAVTRVVLRAWLGRRTMPGVPCAPSPLGLPWS